MEASANWSAAESPLIKKEACRTAGRQEWSGREGVNYTAGRSSVRGNRRRGPRDGGVRLVLTHCGWNNGQGLLVVVPQLLQHIGLHLAYTTREGQLDQTVDAPAEMRTHKNAAESGTLCPNLLFDEKLMVFFHACYMPAQPLVASCAKRERPSRPSYTAGGSRLEAPWIRLQKATKMPN